MPHKGPLHPDQDKIPYMLHRYQNVLPAHILCTDASINDKQQCDVDTMSTILKEILWGTSPNCYMNAQGNKIVNCTYFSGHVWHSG